MRVVAVGDNCIDYYPKLRRWYPTGNCVDFAVNVAAEGVETGIVTVTGSDIFGQRMEAMLRAKGVDCSHLTHIEGKTACAMMDLVGESGKDRLHVSFDEGVLPRFDLTEEDLDYIGTFDIVHSMAFGYVNRHIPGIKAMGKTILYDFSTFSGNFPQREMVLPCIDYGFCSFPQEDEKTLAAVRRLHEEGVKVVIATLGDKGSLAYDGEKFYRIGCSPIRELCNTVGAGDSYIAGFACGLTRGMDIPGCMEYGAAVAARIVQVFEPYEDYGPDRIGYQDVEVV